MCYGMGCGWEDYMGECVKPRGIECPEEDRSEEELEDLEDADV